MQRSLKITWRDFPLSSAVEDQIREEFAALKPYFKLLNGCEVTLEAPAINHRQKRGPFLVRIRLTVSGRELVVDRQAQKKLSQAVREAFDAARRRLKDYAREMRGAVETHEATTRGR